MALSFTAGTAVHPDDLGGASDDRHVEDVAREVEGTDETGFRGRGRDLNSGPEKGETYFDHIKIATRPTLEPEELYFLKSLFKSENFVKKSFLTCFCLILIFG
jgi:hypothetical protein